MAGRSAKRFLHWLGRHAVRLGQVRPSASSDSGRELSDARDARRAAPRPGRSDGLLALALAQARKSPTERRKLVDRRVGADRRSILRLADGQAPRERRERGRRWSDGSGSA